MESNQDRPWRGHSTKNGYMAIVNEKEKTGGDTDQLAAIIDTHLGKKFKIETDTVFSSFLNREDYDYASIQGEGPAGRTPVQRYANLLRDEASRTLREEFAKRGVTGPVPAEAARDQRAEVEGAVSGEVIHYSRFRMKQSQANTAELGKLEMKQSGSQKSPRFILQAIIELMEAFIQKIERDEK
jgi:hypothetical protein